LPLPTETKNATEIKMNELDNLFNMCLNSELPDQEKMRKQFDATFSYNAPKKRRNTIHSIQAPRQFSFPKMSSTTKQRKQQHKRRGTVIQDAVIDLNALQAQHNDMAQTCSKIPFRHLIEEALESSPNAPLSFAEIIRWMFANMADLETDDIHEMFKWQKGIKRVLETDSRFVCDDMKRWSLRQLRDDDVGYHSRNGSFMSTIDDQHHQQMPHSPAYKKVVFEANIK
jgi:hypothetical protein